MMLLLVHAGATLALVGLIWTIQVVHYPLMSDVGPDTFVRYQERHMQLVTFVVAPLMIVEGLTAVAIVLSEPAEISVVGMILLVAIWLSTALVQVPCHKRLIEGFDPEAHDRLVRSNWIRTVLWSVRGFLALILIP